jgi:hypothetical protein
LTLIFLLAIIRAKVIGIYERKDVKYKVFGLTVLLAVFAVSALAQSQISGTIKCGGAKGDVEHMIDVGDHPGHLLVIGKGTCTWTAPIVIAGVKATTQTGASTTEVNGATFQDRGSAFITMENGDKIYVRNQHTGNSTDGGKTSTYEGTWSFTGGTGKFKGLKGKGSYKGSQTPDGMATSQVEGEYTLLEPATPVNKK